MSNNDIKDSRTKACTASSVSTRPNSDCKNSWVKSDSVFIVPVRLYADSMVCSTSKIVGLIMFIIRIKLLQL